MFSIPFVSQSAFQSKIKSSIITSRLFTSVIFKAHQSSQTSVDPTTVLQFGKMAQDWWDESESGSVRPLHSMNSLRVPMVREGLFLTGAIEEKRRNTPKPLSDIQILDVGCGGGLLSEPLARLGAFVTGIDSSSNLISVAEEHAKLDSSLEGRLKYLNTNSETHATEAVDKYDAVISSEVLEHVLNKQYFIEQCVRMLKPKGSIFLTTMNRTTLSYFGGILGAEYILRIVPQGTHQWEQFIQPSELKMLLEKCGCSVKLIHGMCYNPINNEWKWSQDVSINYAIHAIKMHQS